MQLANDAIHLFDFIGGLVCHQRPDRTLWIGGRYLPVCARDTGAYIGLLLGYAMVMFLRRKEAKGPPDLCLSFSMTLPLITDSIGQALGLWTSTNDLRLITGLLFGTALAPFLVYALSLPPFEGGMPVLRRLQPKDPSLDDKNSWFDARALMIGLVFSVISFFGIRSLAGSEFQPFYWLLSIPVVSAILWHFFILPPLLLVAIMQKRRRTGKGKTQTVTSG